MRNNKQPRPGSVAAERMNKRSAAQMAEVVFPPGQPPKLIHKSTKSRARQGHPSSVTYRFLEMLDEVRELPDAEARLERVRAWVNSEIDTRFGGDVRRAVPVLMREESEAEGRENELQVRYAMGEDVGLEYAEALEVEAGIQMEMARRIREEAA